MKRFINAARWLKENEDFDGDGYWRNIYLNIAPDRDREERLEHKKLVLVAELKQMIAAEPTKYHYIRAGKVLSIDKLILQG